MNWGCMWRRASTPSTRTPGSPAVNARSSRASAPQPTMTSRGASSRGTGSALVDEPAGRLRGDTGVAAVSIGPDRGPELLVQRRAADEDDVVLADALVLQRLNDHLHVRHGGREERGH